MVCHVHWVFYMNKDTNCRHSLQPKVDILSLVARATPTPTKSASEIILRPRLCQFILLSSQYSPLNVIVSRPGTLPIGQNSPQKNKHDLYAEGVRRIIISRTSDIDHDNRLMEHLSPCQGPRTSIRESMH